MVDGAHSDAEFCGDSESALRNICTFLELLDAGIHILFEQILHALTQHHLSFLFQVW